MRSRILLSAAALLAVSAPVPALGQGAGERVMVCTVDAAGREGNARMTPKEAEAAFRDTRAYAGPCAALGPAALMGAGQLRTYGQVDAARRPLTLGIVLPGKAIGGLPTAPHDGFRCLDVDEDGTVQMERECVGGHERVLFLPRAWEDEVPSPFQWALFNWNPHGHGPARIWDVPHFDFHFFIQSLSERNEIRIGKCAMLVDCEDLERGAQPVPDYFIPPEYEDRGVVEFGMGNHLIDPRTFGSTGRRPTHTFIYGSWAGRVSFFEPMITLAYLEDLRAGRAQSGCHDIPQPLAFELDAFYPTRYCVRYRGNRDEFAVSLEGFVQRMADEGGRE